MGIVLGYLYFITQNLWVSIIAHFVNNASMISLKYAYMNGIISLDLSESKDISLIYSLGAGIILFFLLFFISRNKARFTNQKLQTNE
jgi:membrane protease YdiL (CAAX protease family)